MTAAPEQTRTAPSDGEMLAAIANGNLEALGLLFDKHGHGVRSFLVRMGVTASDADDLLQATFLEVVRAAGRFDPRFPARNWLLGIANAMLHRHRRSAHRAAARLLAAAGFAPASVPPTPAEIFDGDEATHRLDRAFTRLSPKKREAFVLVTLEGLSGDEAAHVLGVPVNTVWTRLHHARAELRAALAEDAE
jgi:RNA polymerase sigma-70 factor (ECF subfamily)